MERGAGRQSALLGRLDAAAAAAEELRCDGNEPDDEEDEGEEHSEEDGVEVVEGDWVEVLLRLFEEDDLRASVAGVG